MRKDAGATLPKGGGAIRQNPQQKKGWKKKKRAKENWGEEKEKDEKGRIFLGAGLKKIKITKVKKTKTSAQPSGKENTQGRGEPGP